MYFEHIYLSCALIYSPLVPLEPNFLPFSPLLYPFLFTYLEKPTNGPEKWAQWCNESFADKPETCIFPRKGETDSHILFSGLHMHSYTHK